MPSCVQLGAASENSEARVRRNLGVTQTTLISQLWKFRFRGSQVAAVSELGLEGVWHSCLQHTLHLPSAAEVRMASLGRAPLTLMENSLQSDDIEQNCTTLEDQSALASMAKHSEQDAP